MAKSFVLKALRLFSFEEMLNLTPGRKAMQQMKKAAGGFEELVDWGETTTETVAEVRQATVLPFKTKEPATAPTPLEVQPSSWTPTQEQTPGKAPLLEESSHFYSSEEHLWQRELSKESPHSNKKEAVHGYSKATEMYVVKSIEPAGKEKIRFASTSGVLVNKKQA